MAQQLIVIICDRFRLYIHTNHLKISDTMLCRVISCDLMLAREERVGRLSPHNRLLIVYKGFVL